MDIEQAGPDPAAPPEGSTIRLRPEVSRSTTPGVGRPLTALKRGLLRLLGQPLDDLASQTSTAVERSTADAREALTAAREGREWAERALAAEAAAREATQSDVGGLLRRIESIDQSLDRLQLAPRLARLEREHRRETATPGAPEPTSAPASPSGFSAADPPLDYLAFEARFRGSEESIRARQLAYRDLLAGRRRVVDLGCGRGELVQLLSEDGVGAYGVEMNADFVDLVAERGLEVVRQDLMEHLEGLSTGEVDGIVLSHVVEHLPPHVVTHLVETAWEKLPEGGLLIMETPNPESLVAGSVNFHRDPTHLRPVHPDTLAFICDSAGFVSTEILRLSPVADADLLPVVASPDGGPLAEYLDRVVERLNDLLFGFQDYAVVARR